MHVHIFTDQKELPGELWFDLLLTCADGPEQCKYKHVKSHQTLISS